MSQDKVKAHKIPRKEKKTVEGCYPAILTEEDWSIKDLLYRNEIFL